MTQTAAIAKALLDGEKLSIMDGFKKFQCSNIPREVSRSIETKFRVVLDREPVKFTSKYGRKGEYYRYSLPGSKKNKEGIKAMKEYVKSQIDNNKK